LTRQVGVNIPDNVAIQPLLIALWLAEADKRNLNVCACKRPWKFVPRFKDTEAFNDSIHNWSVRASTNGTGRYQPHTLTLIMQYLLP
jgi:hypothetical protein